MGACHPPFHEAHQLVETCATCMKGNYLAFFVILSSIRCVLTCDYLYERQAFTFFVILSCITYRLICGYSYERQPFNILHSFVLYYMWIYLYEKQSLNVFCSFILYYIWVERCHLHFETDCSLHKHRHLRKLSK